jgi:hypothetical protein
MRKVVASRLSACLAAVDHPPVCCGVALGGASGVNPPG